MALVSVVRSGIVLTFCCVAMSEFGLPDGAGAPGVVVVVVGGGVYGLGKLVPKIGAVIGAL